MAKKYVVFDLDGTLIDSIPDMCREVGLLLKDYGRRPLTRDEAESVIGHGAKHMIEGAFALTGEPLSPERCEEILKVWINQYSHAQMNLTKPWEGVLETLQRLKKDGYHMAVCTNKPAAPTAAIMKKLALEQYFDVVLHADSLPVRKPRPEPLWEAVRRMGGTNDQAVMVGDSEPDAEAAKNAGFPVILLSFGYARKPMKEINPTAVIDRFADLPDILKKV